MEEPRKNSSGILWGVAVLFVVVASFGTWKYMKKDSTNATPVDNTVTTPPVTVPVDVTTSYLYKDGDYSATGNYNSPGGAEQIGVKLTLKGDVITDATITSLATRPESKNWQGKFISGVKAQVVGKKIQDVQLSKVSGSSLTPKGFNDALAQIKTQAKA